MEHESNITVTMETRWFGGILLWIMDKTAWWMPYRIWRFIHDFTTRYAWKWEETPPWTNTR